MEKQKDDKPVNLWDELPRRFGKGELDQALLERALGTIKETGKLHDQRQCNIRRGVLDNANKLIL